MNDAAASAALVVAAATDNGARIVGSEAARRGAWSRFFSLTSQRPQPACGGPWAFLSRHITSFHPPFAVEAAVIGRM